MKIHPSSAALLALILLAPGCVLGGSRYKRPRDLDDAWMVDKLRLLGIRGTPAEAAPGETVDLEALLVDPQESVEMVIWLACAWTDSESDGCAVDLSALDLEDPTPEDLAAAGVVGIEPFWSPVYEVPTGFLDGLDERTRENGAYLSLQVMALPEGAAQAEDGAEIDYNLVEVGTKLLPISQSVTPNQNPEIIGWTLDGLELPPRGPVLLDAGQAYDVGILLSDASVEDYMWMESDGDLRENTEEPYTTWFASGGELLESWTIHPHHEATWVAAEAGTGTWWAVVRDRRGGMSWSWRDFEIR